MVSVKRIKMNGHIKIFLGLYLIFSVLAITSILRWGGYLTVNWLPKSSFFYTIEMFGVTFTTLLMVGTITRSKVAREP